MNLFILQILLFVLDLVLESFTRIIVTWRILTGFKIRTSLDFLCLEPDFNQILPYHSPNESSHLLKITPFVNHLSIRTHLSEGEDAVIYLLQDVNSTHSKLIFTSLPCGQNNLHNIFIMTVVWAAATSLLTLIIYIAPVFCVWTFGRLLLGHSSRVARGRRRRFISACLARQSTRWQNWGILGPSPEATTITYFSVARQTPFSYSPLVIRRGTATNFVGLHSVHKEWIFITSLSNFRVSVNCFFSANRNVRNVQKVSLQYYQCFDKPVAQINNKIFILWA